MSDYVVGVVPGRGASSAYVLAQVEKATADSFQVLAAALDTASRSYALQAFALEWLLETYAPGSTGRAHLNITGLGTPVLNVFAERLARRFTVRGYRLVEDESADLAASPPMLGKLYLLSRLETLIQGGRLHLPEDEDGQRLGQAIRALPPGGSIPGGEQGALLVALGLAVCERGSSGMGMLWLDVDPWAEDEPDLRRTDYRAYLRRVRGY